MTAFACCDQNRRRLVFGKPGLNGIDWLDVVDLEAPTPALRQRQLRVGFVNAPAPAGLTPTNVAIGGGERIVGITADTVAYDGEVLVVHLTAYGDFSPYVLALVNSDGSPLTGLDPLLSQITFNFKVECPTDIDCQVDDTCQPATLPTPPIDYMAKDYASFVTLMLDRMSVTTPDWTERNPADIGVAMVEMLAYVADRLSYQQDAVATEAYLNTARRRVSVRRHAKLVDYAMHDGCNARLWAVLTVSGAADGQTLPGPQPGLLPTPLPGTLLITRVQDATQVTQAERDIALNALPAAFETMHDLVLYPVLNNLSFYTWGDTRCCLPTGATTATLSAPANLPDLRGRVLLFQEMLSPSTGRPADADPSHRCAVRVTGMDPLPGQPSRIDPVTLDPVVDITWDAADALPFPLCISAVTDAAHGSTTLPAVSTIWGNVVLVDNGLTMPVEDLGVVPEPSLYAVVPGGDRCTLTPPQAIPVRYNPALANAPLTQTGQVEQTQIFEGNEEATLAPFDPTAPATAAMQWDMQLTLPAIQVFSTDASGTREWSVQQDLLESTETATDFVAELDSDGVTRLRFGDDEYGMRPVTGDDFTAIYRIGNGTAGNVGAGALAHVVEPPLGAPLAAAIPPGILTVANPMPALGGTDPETLDAVKMAAPAAFRVQERAVTPADYVAVSLRDTQVREAAVQFRWTGSWQTVFDTVDRPGGAVVDTGFATSVTSFLERYRVIGHDLQVNPPQFVPLRIDMTVCVASPWFRADIETQIRALFGTGLLPDGTMGFFDPDNHDFGETLYLSRLYALAQSVPGVSEVTVTRFELLYQPSGEGLANWELTFGPTQMPRCDNDPTYPEHGVLNLTVQGGQ